MIKLKSFFSFITRNAQSITIKLKQDLKSIVNTDNLDELNTKLSSQRGCYLLFDQTFRCLKEIDPVIEAISDQLVFPLESFSQNYHNLYKEAFEEILSVIFDITVYYISYQMSMREQSKMWTKLSTNISNQL